MAPARSKKRTPRRNQSDKDTPALSPQRIVNARNSSTMTVRRKEYLMTSASHTRPAAGLLSSLPGPRQKISVHLSTR